MSASEKAQKLFNDQLTELKRFNHEISMNEIPDELFEEYQNMIKTDQSLSKSRAEVFKGLVNLFSTITTTQNQKLEQINNLEKDIRDLGEEIKQFGNGFKQTIDEIWESVQAGNNQ